MRYQYKSTNTDADAALQSVDKAHDALAAAIDEQKTGLLKAIVTGVASGTAAVSAIHVSAYYCIQLCMCPHTAACVCVLMCVS